MKSKEYIIKQIQSFSCRNNSYKISYWCSENGFNHFIEVIPDSGDTFLNEEIEFLENFNDRYPSENIGFITSSDLKFLKSIKLIYSFEPIVIHPWAPYTISEFVLDLSKYEPLSFFKSQGSFRLYPSSAVFYENLIAYGFDDSKISKAVTIEAEAWNSSCQTKRGTHELHQLSSQVI